MNKIPKLRFPGFSGEWECKKLGKLLQFKNGINASKEQYGKGAKFINVLDILNNDFITYDNIIGRVDVDEETLEKYSVEYGDVLFQRSSETREEVGTANVYLDKEKKASFGGFVIRGKKVGEFNPIFINKLLKTSLARKEITTKSGGSTRYNVGQDILVDVELLFPSLDEQNKIASIFFLIDDKIKKQQNKVEALQDYKKGIMQKIFSQEIRFKDENGKEYTDWEERYIGETLKIRHGKDQKSIQVAEGKYPILGTGGEIGRTDTPIYDKESVLIGRKGTIDRPIFMNTPFWTVDTLFYSEVNIDYDAKFLFYCFQCINWKLYSEASGVPSLSAATVESIKYNVPQKEEQQKIASFLSLVDKKVEKEKEKLDSLNQFKKSLLQQMFV